MVFVSIKQGTQAGTPGSVGFTVRLEPSEAIKLPAGREAIWLNSAILRALSGMDELEHARACMDRMCTRCRKSG